MKKKETLNFRVSAEFKRKLTEEAKKERRSLTNYIEAALNRLWELQELETRAKAEKAKRS
jgi:predicted HicB family RNase H-like nuclease